MSLTRQLEPEEWDIITIMTDPILLGEFMRNTADGSPTKEEWTKVPFKYRWYQKDLLTDKSEFISLVAGRAVGKCSPLNARIYTYPFGYVTIRDLLAKIKHAMAVVDTGVLYSVDENNELVHKRMVIKKNGKKNVFRITTSRGHIFEGTENHPIMTQRGYIMIKDLQEDDNAAVAAFLPHDSPKKQFNWEELRWFGYCGGAHSIGPEMAYPIKFQRNVLELQRISKHFDAVLERLPDGTYRLRRKRGPLPHYGSLLIEECRLTNARTSGLVRVPFPIKSECLEHIKYFLESLFSLWAVFTNDDIKLTHHAKTFAYDIQELLLRFGVESRVSQLENSLWEVHVSDYYSFYKFFEELDIPGVTATNLRMPTIEERPLSFMRYDPIVSIEPRGSQYTFAVMVRGTENYISDNLFVHNSLVLEDKIIYEAINADTVFPVTKESTLVTANVSQMTPILDRLIMRLSNSFLLKDFLKGQINRSKGTMDFPMPGGTNYRINARIAGSKGENNMVGLHVPKIIGDEFQIFPMAAFVQLGPTYNGWEPGSSQFYAGVPNGIREGNVLYSIDQRQPKYKKYRIPAHQNPYYSYQDDRENMLTYGGKDSDDYQHLVLGKHGEPAFSIIPRDKIVLEPFEFWTHRYTQTDKHAGRDYKTQLQLHRLPEQKSLVRVLAVDTGYADPTVAQVIGQDKNGVWRTFVRYRLTRIPFPEQADIIDWLDSHYNFNLICVDLGAGGGGIGLTQDLQSGRFAKTKKYDKRIYGVRFADYLDSGESATGVPMKTQAKSFAGQELARHITEGGLIFSELDMEGVSQMERVAYQRRGDGTNQYFVLSERGTGKSADDHIFASYVVFTLTLLTALFHKPKKSLFKPRWV